MQKITKISAAKRELKAANKRYPTHLVEIDKENWPSLDNDTRFRVLRSRHFLVQVFDEGECLRMSVNKTDIDHDGGWKENVSWEQLQQLKRQAGYGNLYAVEVYPCDSDLVNVANMRHLWIMDKPLGIGWTREVCL